MPHRRRLIARNGPLAARTTLLLVLLATLFGCRPVGTRRDVEPRYPLRVVCTTGHVADMLAHIGGEHVRVESLMGPGVDPHLYKITPAATRKLRDADVVFYSGLHLEGRLAGLLEKLGQRKHVFAVSDGLVRDHSPLLRTGDSGGAHDPHIWFDVALWGQCVDHAKEQLAAVDPDHAADYRRNAAEYRARLNVLHRECREQLASIPKTRRVLVTAHDAFGYFGDAYDVEVRGLQGISTSDEADLGSVNALVDMLAERQVKAVFVESSVPAKNIRALVEGCAARGHAVVIGGELYSDALGPPGTEEETYEGTVRFNLRTIVEALK
ncbi:MAG: zinc ABC transporter substrate-binding protein [Planctomycetes bacterium]|nr:zinc ABC transporter substrate-binding protein [Planctomycetota bacterium]